MHIRISFFALLLTFFLISRVNAQLNSKSFSATVKKKVSGNYLIYLPANYKSHKDWPLVLFLHGSGERGNNLELVKKNGIPKLIAEGKKFDFVMVAPQCPEGEDWSAESLREIIRSVVKEYNIDVNRIYATGLSMGGAGTWDLAIAYPDLLAAIAPVCGRVNRNHPGKACSIKNLPTWIFHGENDQVVPVSESKKMITALEQCGVEVKYTIYPGVDHDSWTATYNDPELYKWLLEQRRKK